MEQEHRRTGETSAASTEGMRLIEQARQVLARTFYVDFSFPVIAAAAGITITDIDGREYLDFSSGQMCATLGHRHPAVVAAVHRSADGLMHLNSSLLSADVIRLAHRLVALLPAAAEGRVLEHRRGIDRDRDQDGQEVHGEVRDCGADGFLPWLDPRGELEHVHRLPPLGLRAGLAWHACHPGAELLPLPVASNISLV
jgi:hypothetical protein